MARVVNMSAMPGGSGMAGMLYMRPIGMWSGSSYRWQVSLMIMGFVRMMIHNDNSLSLTYPTPDGVGYHSRLYGLHHARSIRHLAYIGHANKRTRAGPMV